jgi:hypothetical protein
MRSWRLALVLVGSSLILLSADAAIGQDTLKPKVAPAKVSTIKASSFVQALNNKSPKSEAEVVAIANQTMGGSNDIDGIFAVLLEYQKDVAKEAREDARAARAERRTELEAKAVKLELEAQKIDQMRTEAKERFDAAMRVANAELIMGVLSIGAATVSAIGAGAAADGGGPQTAKTIGPVSNVQRIATSPAIALPADAGAPTTSTGPTSPIGKMAFADAVLGGKLSTAARDEVRARRTDFLDAIVKSWETKTSLMMAIRARAAQNAILGKERFAFVLPSAVFDAYEEAFAALAKAPKDKTAAFRARVALETLRVVSQNL